MANSVRNLLGPPLRLRGPVTRADGGKTGIGRGYGGARIDLERLSTTDPHSRQLLAAQIIWTFARADITGPYVINADGAALDDRFADGWETTDVARPTRVPTTAPRPDCTRWSVGRWFRSRTTTRHGVPGSFGQMPEQKAATLSRTGRDIASVVALRSGRRTRMRRCGSARAAGLRSRRPTAAPSRGRAGHSTTRCGWWSTATTWCASSRRPRPGSRRAFRSTATAVTTRFPGPITELQLSRDGTRAAMVIDGQVVLATVEQTPGGEYALTYPRRLGFGLGYVGGVAVVAHGRRHRRQPHRPGASGVLRQPRRGELRRARPATSRRRCRPWWPTRRRSTSPMQRGVLQLSSAAAENEQRWVDVRPLMVPGAIPVLPG